MEWRPCQSLLAGDSSYRTIATIASIALLMELSGLPERHRANLEGLADLREETIEEVAERIAANVLRSVPRSIGGYRVDFSDLDVGASGVEDGYPWLRTAAGRIFYDHPASAKDGLMYALLRDRVPPRLTAETFAVAVHTIRRYIHGAGPVPNDARVVVDAGCYIGYKPIAYADKTGGRVLAVEMVDDNYRLLCRNITANGLDGQVLPIQAALSDSEGVAKVRRKRKQQATIAEADSFDDRFATSGHVPMATLANLFNAHVPEGQVDFLNVQVNGHELEVLGGLGAWVEQVRRIQVIAPYSRDGRPLAHSAAEWCTSRGFAVHAVWANGDLEDVDPHDDRVYDRDVRGFVAAR